MELQNQRAQTLLYPHIIIKLTPQMVIPVPAEAVALTLLCDPVFKIWERGGSRNQHLAVSNFI